MPNGEYNWQWCNERHNKIDERFNKVDEVCHEMENKMEQKFGQIRTLLFGILVSTIGTLIGAVVFLIRQS